ncbi:MAG: UDP-N-acetylglucosamine 4,6-dehydratase (inverting) [Atribacterota bacterium]
MTDKTILLTGGTGSFGKKFTEIVLEKYDPEKLIIFSRDELKQHEMKNLFNNDSRLRFFVGDIRDKERLYRAMDGVDIVVHAAALKRVPSCEYNPFEAVKTNILGAQNIINVGIDCEVEKLIALSTDKAVNPVNLYGATKMCMERLFVAGNSYTGWHETRLACVRYGNVIGSRGSVIPLFKKQAKKEKLTITDERMTRFWITLEQGVELVLQGLETMHGGEVFIPKIPSMKIMDLAKAMAPKAEIETIGIRPGEKIHECLITEDEARHTKEFKDFFIIEPEHPWWDYTLWKEGKELPDGFRYTSNNNDDWLSIEDLNNLIKDL